MDDDIFPGVQPITGEVNTCSNNVQMSFGVFLGAFGGGTLNFFVQQTLLRTQAPAPAVVPVPPIKLFCSPFMLSKMAGQSDDKTDKSTPAAGKNNTPPRKTPVGKNTSPADKNPTPPSASKNTTPPAASAQTADPFMYTLIKFDTPGLDVGICMKQWQFFAEEDDPRTNEPAGTG